LCEARIAGQLEHPNIVPVHEFGADGAGGLYLTMKLVDGLSLADLVDSYGEDRLTPERLANIVGALVRICDALAYAHAQRVVHCDVKPENILVADYGAVYLVDWGSAYTLADSAPAQPIDLSDHTPSGGMIGTPAFMSPEQASGDRARISHSTDVFGLCATLYYALTGNTLYGDVAVPETVYRAVAGQITPISETRGVPPLLARIVMRGLSYRPEDRYQTVMELKTELEHFLRGTWHLPLKRVADGTLIVREGDPSTAAWMIHQGTCEVWTERNGERLVLRTLVAGEVFGEMAILNDTPRTANVVTVGDVILLEVTAETLTDGLGLNSWIGGFVRSLARRFHEADQRLRDTHFSRPPVADAPTRD
jgi:serine/threonine-protein kinase